MCPHMAQGNRAAANSSNTLALQSTQCNRGPKIVLISFICTRERKINRRRKKEIHNVYTFIVLYWAWAWPFKFSNVVPKQSLSGGRCLTHHFLSQMHSSDRSILIKGTRIAVGIYLPWVSLGQSCIQAAQYGAQHSFAFKFKSIKCYQHWKQRNIIHIFIIILINRSIRESVFLFFF